MKIGRLVCLTWAALFLFGTASYAEEPAPPKFEPKIAPEDAADKPVIELDDICIPAKEVWALEKSILEAFKKHRPDFTPSPQDRANLRMELAKKRLGVALIQKLAAEHTVELPDAEVERQLENVRKTLMMRKIAYQDFIVGRGCMTADEFKAVTRSGMILERALAKDVQEEEIKKAFEMHSEGLPLRRCSHVLYGYKGARSVQATRTKEEAKKLAEEVLTKIKADKAFDFAQLARETSDCTSKSRGGDLNFSPKKGEGQMVPAFANALYSLPEVGAFSDVIETPFGFHVIKLTEIRGIKEFEPHIRRQMAQQKVGQLIQQKMGEKEKNLKTNKELLAMLPPGSEIPKPAPEKVPSPKKAPAPEKGPAPKEEPKTK